MDVTKTIPNYNPADATSLSGLSNILKNTILRNLENAIPAIVQSYNRSKNRAIVKPAISGIASQGQKVSKEPLIDIPVFCMSGGGIVMSFPIQEGDTGWLIANDRNISIFKQNLTESAPNDFRLHSFSDGFFLPDKINDININENDNDALVIQTLAGTTKITLKEGEIVLTSPIITINGDTFINGSLTVSTETTTKGIPFTTHIHPYTDDGTPMDTGVPK